MLRLSAILSLSFVIYPTVDVHGMGQDGRPSAMEDLGNDRQDGRSSAMEDASALDLDMEDRSNAGLLVEKHGEALWPPWRLPRKPKKKALSKQEERRARIKKVRAEIKKNSQRRRRRSSKNKQLADLQKKVADLNKQVADLNKHKQAAMVQAERDATLMAEKKTEKNVKEDKEKLVADESANGLLEEVKKIDRAAEREVADLKVQLAAAQKAKERAEREVADLKVQLAAAPKAKERAEQKATDAERDRCY